MSKRVMVLGLFVALAACAAPSEGGGADASTQAQTGSTDDTRGTEDGPATTASTEGTGGTVSTSDGDTTSSGEATDADTDAPNDDGDDEDTPSLLCTPTPNDDDCTTCAKASCCDEVEACVADGNTEEGCLCFMLCQANGGNLLECRQQCNTPLLLGNGATAQLGQCTALNCNIKCVG